MVGAALALLVMAMLASGCSTAPRRAGGSTTTTSHVSTTTTTGLPHSLQSNPDAAAAALVADWAAGDRPAALGVATPDAVATLFAIPYPRGLALNRGCSTAFPPIVCTYGPPGGAPPTDPIYEIYVSQAGAGWYVSSTRVN
jgi:hypothetical protein